MKKLFAVILMILSICSIAEARPSKGGSISATSTEQEVALAGRNVYLKNDGANEVYLELEIDQADGTATTADFELRTNEEIYFSSDNNISAIKIICAAAETATVRYISWE